mmetsp:Transcript_58416/g.162855  ORF Transcript_58416/g.162855 Transcript_58416/m.162855 type:complete len:234 (-) Transcript_58416:105-806(-)
MALPASAAAAVGVARLPRGGAVTMRVCCQPRLPHAAMALLSMFFFTLPLGTAGIEVAVTVDGKGRKCYGEQVAKQELLVVEFATIGEKKKVSVQVLGPHSTIFSEHDREKVKTAFTTTEAGAHWMCIQNEDAEPTEVKMSVLVGPQAKDYSKIAKKEHLEETQIALRRVEENLRSYHGNVLYIRAREERMRQTNDSTAFRVIGFCLFNVVLMIGVGGWQMLYFKRFFRAKKII